VPILRRLDTRSHDGGLVPLHPGVRAVFGHSRVLAAHRWLDALLPRSLECRVVHGPTKDPRPVLGCTGADRRFDAIRPPGRTLEQSAARLGIWLIEHRSGDDLCFEPLHFARADLVRRTVQCLPVTWRLQ
jgi:hypothetical protein